LAGHASREGVPLASLDMAAPKLGSGARFKKLSATLAARGAHDPDALAAWIGRRKFGASGMGRLSHGKSLANPDLGIYLSETAKDEQGLTLTCPECNYSGPANRFGSSGASLDKSPDDLQTPAPSTGAVRDGVPLTVRTGAAHALAGDARSTISLAAGTLTARRNPVKSPVDVIVARGEDGQAVIRHRQGGATIAQIRKGDNGQWVATVDGRDLTPHAHQRTALMEAVGTWNRAAAGGLRTPSAPLQPAPEQTPLMQQYGIPAIRALATPTAGSSDGPRMTTAAGGDDGTDDNGLNAKGQGIYKRLLAKGLKPGVALAFAKRAQNTKPGVFGKAAS
jgi:hypothetical protein